jgi:hypothetical protein
MHLHHQLKRGYLALIGLAALSFAIMALPTASSAEDNPLAVAGLTRDACLANAKSNWKLASTPIDIQSLLLRKALICQA